MALTNKLSAIGDAIREKTGKTELLTLDAMPLEIASITTGGGGSEDCNGLHIPEEALLITGDCSNRFIGNGWNWFIELCGDKIQATGITDMYNFAYNNTNIKRFPFWIFCVYNFPINLNGAFCNCADLREPPIFSNVQPQGMFNAFNNCHRLVRFPGDYWDNGWDWSFVNNASQYEVEYDSMFNCCYSLRYVPGFKQSQINPRSEYPIYLYGFTNCHVIDEIYLPVYNEAEYWDNKFIETFDNCNRLSLVQFNTNEDGSPIQCPGWHCQTLDFRNQVGYTDNPWNILNYSDIHGITEANKNYEYGYSGTNYWTDELHRSCFNYGSAFLLIESLPDCSAGTDNMVIFDPVAGSMLGAMISDLTEEDIAIAVSKGWTISYG